MAALLLAAAAFVTSACGEVARTGRSPAYLQIESLEGASGATPDEFGATVSSDVLTLVEQDINGQKVKVPTIYGDIGRVSFRVGLKDPGPTGAPTTPSSLNAITVTRYRVVYRRSDGRNTQGVDVPYAFDGAFTVTVPASGTGGAGFDLVRIAAKREPPLANMAGNLGGALFITTIAEITFYGKDQAGNDVSATGTMSVSFADFGDPK
ncbi:MAG: hypothetical protein IT178_10450 [Acidobacteria bacterium]|nr:hypothetical protein [Acidobacteriota bacterium]